MAKTTSKPEKPHPDFPLIAHNNGQWCKKIRGKVHFFGVWAEADQALWNYCEVRDDLQAGRQPQTTSSQPSLKDACNACLTRAKQREKAGEISPRTFQDYHETVRILLDYFGNSLHATQIRPTEFGDFRTRIAKDYSSRQETEKKLFSAADIRSILDHCDST
ncbi:MAG: hypothetical protein R3C59_30780, partial [Planctomycetaceae bacterium]